MQEWYLLGEHTRPNSLGGFENDAFLQYRNDAVYEAFESELASTIVLYNSDLSEGKEIRAIVEDNMTNTYLSSQGRELLTPIGTVKTGNYVYHENDYWLLTGYPGNNKLVEKTTMGICQYKIKWQNEQGEIIERWAHILSASKYDVGKYETRFNTIPTNAFIMMLPFDSETMLLYEKRLFIDHNSENPLAVFKVTRNDDPLYIYGDHGGILSFIVSRDTLDTSRDRPDLMLCDYVEKGTETGTVNTSDAYAVHIVGDSKLKLGVKAYYSFEISDTSEESTASIPEFRWNVEADIPSEILLFNTSNTSVTGCELMILDEEYLGESFELQVLNGDCLCSSITIKIVNIFEG